MALSIKPKYEPITQLPHCCEPTCIQMILKRRGLECESQEDIGWELGLIVSKAKKRFFKRVRTGKKPKAGYGTRCSQKRYSVENYFKDKKLPLRAEFLKLGQIQGPEKFLAKNLKDNNDVQVCFYNEKLFGKGKWGHVCLIQEINSKTKTVVLIDPSKGVPKKRKVKLDKLLEAIKHHEQYSKGAGFTLIKSK